MELFETDLQEFSLEIHAMQLPCKIIILPVSCNTLHVHRFALSSSPTLDCGVDVGQAEP